MTAFLNFMILLLCLIGFWISLYFTGVYYRWFPSNVFWIPKICQLTEQSCLSVLETPRAKLFGIPNSAFGMALYLFLIADLVLFPPVLGFVLISLALVRSIYLAYSLLFVTKIPCPLCFTGHLINLLLFAIYAKIIFS